ncbi:MAG: ABC transporter ATP-binding protein, partial [Flavisolibacter sp.]
LTILFRNPNFLILDEPTNDLDLPTLSVLENFLLEFQGCLVIVSHDRYFMDRLVDHLFVFEGEGEVRDFPGNYSQYREWLKQNDNMSLPDPKQPILVSEPAANIKKKLSYKEQREFETLEKEIASLEIEKKALAERILSSGHSFEELQRLSERIGEISSLIDEKELRWLELSETTS